MSGPLTRPSEFNRRPGHAIRVSASCEVLTAERSSVASARSVPICYVIAPRRNQTRARGRSFHPSLPAGSVAVAFSLHLRGTPYANGRARWRVYFRHLHEGAALRTAARAHPVRGRRGSNCARRRHVHGPAAGREATSDRGGIPASRAGDPAAWEKIHGPLEENRS